MHLKSLVLKGFKSFADRSVMSFEPGIAAIVGPNGSGKSNISDAVLWVLGERNARNLRGQSMEDVIFSGSSARKPQGMAEVSLVLDNSDGTLPVDYSEVSLTRRMYRDGESEYLINGTLARRMDVLDILHDSGLGTGIHSIIGQGQLSSILQSKPSDLRMLIEEAAGVLKHKQRKEKSERKLDLMDAQLTRVQDIVSEVKRQMKPLERKAKHAIEHREVSAQLADLDLQLAVDDLRNLQMEWDRIEAAESQADAAAKSLQEQIQAKEAHAQELQAQLQQFIAGAGEFSQKHSRAQAALNKIDSDILLLREKKRSTVDYLAEMRISLENDIRVAAAARAQRDAASKSMEEAARADADAQQARKAAQEALDAQRSAQRTLQQEVDRLSHRRRDALSELEEARGLLARTQEILSSNRARTQMIDIQAQDLSERLKSAEAEHELAARQDSELQSQLGAAVSEEAVLREESGLAMRERDKARSAADRAREAKSSANAHLKGLESAWRSRQAKNPMRARGVELAERLGLSALPLASQVSVPEGIEPLLGHLLGEGVNAVFMEGADDAIAIAREMGSDAPSGVLTMIPCEGEARSGGGGARSLIDLVDASPKVKGALGRLLGNVLLFESFQQAAEHSRAHQGVTCACPDGRVVWADGRVTCFKAREGEASELADYREIEVARKAACDAEAECAQAVEAAEAREADLRSVQARGLELSQRIAHLKGRAQASASELARADRVLKSLRSESSKLDEQRRAADAALAKAQPDAIAYEERVRALSDELETLKEQIESKRNELAPVRSAADKAAFDLSEAKVASAACSERLAYAKRMLESCDRDIRKADEQSQRARAGIARKEASLERIDPVALLLSQVSEAARAKVAQLERQISQSQGRSDELHESINEVRAALRASYEERDSHAQRLADVRVEKSRIEMKVEAVVGSIVRDCGMPLESALEIKLSDERSLVEDQAARLRRRIAGMGAVNPDAVEEYEALKLRFDYLSAQLGDMLSARKSLNRIVSAIDARMRDDFAKTFKVVDANFQEAFASLFPGGRGSLSLTDPDDLDATGVEVSAQPSGKRILKMTLMSGGEKSLTALALLFAVYKTRATPFYILDEVEAALDDTNLRRLVAYLNTLRDSSQFIIITHQRRTMETADVLYGVSMQADGVTKVMSQRLDNALRYAEG